MSPNNLGERRGISPTREPVEPVEPTDTLSAFMCARPLDPVDVSRGLACCADVPCCFDISITYLSKPSSDCWLFCEPVIGFAGDDGLATIAIGIVVSIMFMSAASTGWATGALIRLGRLSCDE